jgi:hypothetical protein
MKPQESQQGNKLQIDESARIKQREWTHLLEIEELAVPVLPPCPLSIDNQLFLASIWLKDAVKGRNVDFPQSEYQLQCYYITRSHLFLIFYSAVCFFHLFLPFFEQPFCAWTSHGSRNYDYTNPPSDPNYLSPHTVAILSFFCLLVYLVEVFMRLSVNFHHRKQRALDFWTKVRLALVVVMIIDALYAMAAYSPQVLRALLPMVYITRRKSLRQMTSGLFLAASKCTSVFILLFCILLAWSYLGSMIFGQIELDVSGRFGSLLKSFLTTLESYSCRGYIIYALDPLFEINPATATYFVTLSIFADILCSALVIATGTRQYQLYAARIFKKELLNRKQSMLAVFGVLYHCSEELASTTRESREASHCIPSYSLDGALNEHNDRHSRAGGGLHDSPSSLFMRISLYNPLVDKKDQTQYISKEIWLNFCAHLKGRYEMSAELATMLFNSEVAPGAKGLTREGLFNLAALLDGHMKIEGTVPAMAEAEQGQFSVDDVGQIDPYGPRTISAAERISKLLRTPPGPVDEGGILLSTLNGSPQSEKAASNSTTPSPLSAWTQFKTRLRIAKTEYCQGCQHIMRASLTLPTHVPLFSDSLNRICYFEYAVFIARLLLIFQLIFMAKPSAPKGWIYFGWCLEIFFWCEMMIRLGAAAGWSIHHYTRLIVINVITLALIISVDTEQSLSGKMIALICFQWIRLIRVFLPFNASKALRTLLPLLFRVLFLVFTVIYFFANLGYYRFCNSFDVQEASEVDDWAERWVPYEKQLNFNTMTQTMYTLFQVAILGNWSFVMRASMLSGAAAAAIFFYSYRLIMTLVVLPILTSFVIQAYNARSARLDEMEQEKRKAMEDASRVFVVAGLPSDLSQGAVLNTIHEDCETQRGTQLSESSQVSQESASSVPPPQSMTIISRGMFIPPPSPSPSHAPSPSVEETENSMISFWSGSGNEHYTTAAATPAQKPARRSSTTSLQGADGTTHVLTSEELVQKLNSALISLEFFKSATDTLSKENQALKAQLKQTQEIIEFDDDSRKDYT